MKIPRLIAAVATAIVFLSPPGSSSAETWLEGTAYRRIDSPISPGTTHCQVKVVEFFWYGCSHCRAFEPDIEKWLRAKASYVVFEKVPVIWGQPLKRAHAQLFYALQSLGRTDLNPVVFLTIQDQKNYLFAPNDDRETLEIQEKFVEGHGIPRAAFDTAFKSATLQVRTADTMAQTARVDSVPSILVAGKYLSNIEMAQGSTNLLSLADSLISKERESSGCPATTR